MSSLSLLSPRFAICRFAADAEIPSWTAGARMFLSISRTPEELSIVVDQDVVPSVVPAARDYRALRVDGPLPLDLVGVIAALAQPLADAGIPIFPVATHDTDYLFIHHDTLDAALAALTAAGHRIHST